MRVYGINAHETRSLDAEEKRKGLEAKEYAKMLAPNGSSVQVVTHKIGEEEKFGRWLADITLPGDRDFAKLMIAAGHAVPYFGGHRDS